MVLDTIESDAGWSQTFSSLLRGELESTLGRLDITEAVQTLYAVKIEYQIKRRVSGHGVQGSEKSGKAFERYIKIRSNPSTSFEDHWALFTVLKETGFEKEEVENYIKTVMLPYYQDGKAEILSSEKIPEYTVGIKRAFQDVYHVESAQ